MKALSFFALTAILSLLTVSSGCRRIDSNRLPPVNVNIVFTTDGMWAKYGVGGALDSQRFIKSPTAPVPPDFPYTIATYTGYGGILLVGDLFGYPLAYDLACPFEAKPDIRVYVDNDEHDAVCPVCGSTYDVFGGYGRAVSGPAAERGYGMTRYRVIEGDGLNYRVITR